MKIRAWTGLFFFCCWIGGVAYAEGTGSQERGKDLVERRQKIELQKFYFGDGKTGKAPMTPVAIQIYNDGVSFFEKGEYDLAEQAMKESLEIDRRNPLAYEILGEISNLRQDYEKAQAYFKASYLLNPSPRVRKRLEQIDKEHKVEGQLDTYDEEHFIIKYKQGDQGYEGYSLRNMLRDSYRQVSQDFGYYLNHKIVVLFYSAGEFHDVTGQEHWVGGLYDGKIRLPAFRQGVRETDLRSTVTHEMTHAFVAILSGMRAPTWLHEGLAEYEANKVRSVSTALFDAAIKMKTQIPVKVLISEMSPSKKENPQDILLFYQESYSLVSYIAQRYQMYRIKDILTQFKQGKTAEEIIPDVLAVSIDQLEKEWLSSLRK